jgi:hypothetical protein
MEGLTMSGYFDWIATNTFGWIRVIAFAVAGLALWAGLWGAMTQSGRSSRIGRWMHLPGLGIARARRLLKQTPATDDALRAPHNGVGWLEAGTARWLWNDIALLIEQGKLSAPAAAFVRGRADDDKFMARLYRTHVQEVRQFYASEEESVIAACEAVARQDGCRPSSRDGADPRCVA